MKQLILFPFLFVFLTSIAYSAGGWDEGSWNDGVWDFGTPAPEPETSSSGGGGDDSSGGGGGRLFDGVKDKFENGSRTITLAYGDALQFYIKSKQYTLIITKLDKDFAKLRITPNYIDFEVKDIAQIDVDGDKIDDIRIQLNKIKNSYSAEFVFVILEKSAKKGRQTIIPEPIIESELNIAEEPQVINVEESSLENDKPTKEQPKSVAIWIISMSVMIMGILLIVVYQINKDKKLNKDKNNKKI